MTTPATTNAALNPSAPARKGRVRPWLRWLFRPLCFGGLVVGLFCFWLSLTPSLLPRPWFFQGVVSGLSAVVGYGIGSGLSALVRRFARSEPAPEYKRIAWIVLAVVAVLGSLVMLWQSNRWQNELRALVEIDEQNPFSGVGVLITMALVGGLVLLIARLVRSMTRFLIRQVNRILPRWVSITVGVVLAVFVVVGFIQGFLLDGLMEVVNQASSLANGGTTPGTEQPTTSERTGGPGSLVAWETLGVQGRDFVGNGPTVSDLEVLHGAGCCEAPIRVYAGLDSAPSAADRAALAVQELERTGAFDREIIGIFTSTGTGWVDPKVAAGLEYIHSGDTAEVSMQYSYLPSWISFLVDQEEVQEAGQELIGAVVQRVDELPPAEQPMVFVFGESLGSYGTERAFDDLADLRAQADGAMLVGPTFSNPIWRQLTDAREPESPQWLPVLPAETGTTFARTPDDLAGVADNGMEPRVIYLQNSSDPITWFSLRLAFSKPDWAGEPVPPDRSPAFRWFPIVTFWQVLLDLVNAVGVPTGYGHQYGTNVVDGWVAVWKPDGWSDEATQQVRELVEQFEQ